MQEQVAATAIHQNTGAERGPAYLMRSRNNTMQQHFADQVHFSLRGCFSNCKPTDPALLFNGAS